MPAKTRRSSVAVRFAPEKPGEQAGLILYYSDDDYVKIIREFLDGKRWIVFGREQAGDGKMIQALPVESDEVTLRLTRHGQQITGDYRTADHPDESHPLGPTDLPPSKENLRVGLVAPGGPPRRSRGSRRNVRSIPPSHHASAPPYALRLFPQPYNFRTIPRFAARRNLVLCCLWVVMTPSKSIRIRGASEHNLKNIDVEIPRDQLVVITGLSGIGQIDARLRHRLRRGPAEIHRVALGLRPAVPRPASEAGYR